MRNELLDSLAEILEGIVVRGTDPSQTEASILLFHPREKVGEDFTLRDIPLVELSVFERGDTFSVMLQSALGMVELHNVNEIRILELTQEAAFISRLGDVLSILTLSSHGVVQSYTNVSASVIEQDLASIDERDLRAAVALKMFMENAQVHSPVAS